MQTNICSSNRIIRSSLRKKAKEECQFQTNSSSNNYSNTCHRRITLTGQETAPWAAPRFMRQGKACHWSSIRTQSKHKERQQLALPIASCQIKPFPITTSSSILLFRITILILSLLPIFPDILMFIPRLHPSTHSHRRPSFKGESTEKKAHRHPRTFLS